MALPFALYKFEQECTSTRFISSFLLGPCSSLTKNAVSVFSWDSLSFNSHYLHLLFRSLPEFPPLFMLKIISISASLWVIPQSDSRCSLWFQFPSTSSCCSNSKLTNDFQASGGIESKQAEAAEHETWRVCCHNK